jgi:O6-methylguanine-DNA--protein-cysteine methyltransferase
MSFSERACRVVAGIPRGRVMSYSGVAALAGSPGAARAVGTLMSKNFPSRPRRIGECRASNTRPGAGRGKVPCHRVVRSDGSLGGFSGPGGIEAKRAMLEREGVGFRNGIICREHFLHSRP